MDGTAKHKVLKIMGDDSREVEDLVAQETRLKVSINGRHVLSLYCTPLMVRELVVGLVMTEGIADGVCTERMSIIYGEEINVDVTDEGEVRTEGASITSGCVGGITFQKKHTVAARDDGLTITVKTLGELFRKFHARSELYNVTGCIHSAALSDGEDILCFAEDIGRHNAVDKVIGYCILEGLDFKGRVMLASGRLSSEIVSKCAKWGIPVVVSRTAPTALALKIAEESGITVVGFVRGKRMNVYTHTGRVLHGP
jgi:FdhD protein